jgi:hypothetical protein
VVKRRKGRRTEAVRRSGRTAPPVAEGKVLR